MMQKPQEEAPAPRVEQEPMRLRQKSQETAPVPRVEQELVRRLQTGVVQTKAQHGLRDRSHNFFCQARQ